MTATQLPRRTAPAPRTGSRRPVARRPAPPRATYRRPPARTGSPTRRAQVLLLLVVVALIAVTLRLVQLQVVSADEYAARGLAQRLYTRPIPAERGTVFDRNGNELAMSVRQSTVFADPSLVEDPTATAARLAPVLMMDPVALEAKLRQPGEFVYIARKVDDEVAANVEALELRGIALLDESKRFRPNGDLAASVIGSVDVDNGGVSGLELLLDGSLRGTDGEMLLERGLDGRTIAVGERRLTPAHPGDDLVLTIDRSLQYEVETAMAEAIVSTGSSMGMAVVMDIATGEILAMANLRASEDGPPRPTGDNRAVTAVFEPGSVNKVITVAGALEEGIVNPDTVYDVPDRLQVSTHEFSDHDPHPVTPWSVSDIVRTSSNIGTIMIAQRLGVSKVDEYLRRFGLGEPSGLGFPQESAGILKDGRWDGTDIGSIPIGQGIAVNALQMLNVYNILANDGVFVPPRLVRATVDAEGKEHEIAPQDGRRVVSARTAEQVTTMLANVVATGTGMNAAIEGYTVAGKTGTARRPSETALGYEEGAYIASFAGFVPAEEPRLSAIVVLDKPSSVYYASQTSAPVFARIMQYALRQLRVAPPAAVIETDEAPPPQAPGLEVRD